MPRTLASIAGLSALCVSTFLCTASAQPKAQTSITLNIPFEFSLGNRMLPAGTYKLEALLGAPTEEDHMSILALRSVEGHLYHVVVTDVRNGEAKSNSRLVFTDVHGERFLSQLWLAGQHVGFSIRVPQAGAQFLQAREQSQLVELSAPVLNP